MILQLRSIIAHRLSLKSATISERLSAIRFRDSRSYWEQHYASGGDSGAGSYGRLGAFKARFVNQFVYDHHIAEVVEFGCGDGQQLRLASYPKYVGLDVAASALDLCRVRFAHDSTKRFHMLDTRSLRHQSITADLALSLDVIYYLVEEDVFHAHMSQLFDSAKRYVIVYSSNFDSHPTPPSVRHRKFTTWVEEHRPQWSLLRQIPNEFPFEPGRPHDSSPSDFFVFFSRSSAPARHQSGGRVR